MYKVFVYNSVLLLTENPAIKKSHPTISEKIAFENGRQLRKVIRKLAKAKQPTAINIYGSELQTIWKAILKKFKLIEAGGGLVVNSKDGKILMIKRRGLWDLPKGKAEKGESIDQTAIREVSEECGINDLKIGQFICHSYHLFGSRRSKKIKQTTWFAMQSKQNTLTPQTEEDITKVQWLTIKETEKKLEKSYSSIKEVFRQFADANK